MKSYIVFFDSGVGGVSVLREALRLFPDEYYIYLADNLNVPYGKKSTEEIINFTLQSLFKIQNFNIKCLVLACNTATAAAVKILRKLLSYPVIGIEPNISERYTKDKKTLLIATSKTIALRKVKYDSKNIECMACDDLVVYIEKAEISQVFSKIFEISNYCKVNNFENLVLGCTHFVLLKKYFKELISINLIDGNYPTVANMGRLLNLETLNQSKDTENIDRLSVHNVEIILTKKDCRKHKLIKKIARNGFIFKYPLETH